MRTGTKRIATSALSALVFAALPLTAFAQSFEMKEQAGVRWACGGIGAEERAAFAKLEGQSDLKLVFASGKRGEYVSDVAVSLTDATGKRMNLQFTADGPICLLQAPAGNYRVEAAYAQTKQGAAAAIGKQAGKPATVILNFPEAN
jgi:hypothetical protein